MKKPLISICIPTYNRASFLRKTIETIIDIDPAVEVIITDNASTDNTKDAVTQLKKEFPKALIKYKLQRKNLGLDRNMIDAVKLATGKYCWLISDDDLPAKDSFKKIKSIIKAHPKVSFININFSRYDHLLKKITAPRMVSGIKKDLVFKDPNKFFFKPTQDSYFKFLGTNIITMSTDIFRRDLWLKAIPENKPYIDLNFIHCFVLASIMKKHPYIYFVNKPMIQYLSNNHRVWNNDIWKDYNKIFLNHLLDLGYSKESVEHMRRVQREYEQREAITKNLLFKYRYSPGRLLIPVYHFILAKLKKNH